MIFLKWNMIDSKHFTSVYEGYFISVNPPYWDIKKGELMIDCCFYHSPTKGELQAKVQAEKALNKLIHEMVN